MSQADVKGVVEAAPAGAPEAPPPGPAPPLAPILPEAPPAPPIGAPPLEMPPGPPTAPETGRERIEEVFSASVSVEQHPATGVPHIVVMPKGSSIKRQ